MVVGVTARATAAASSRRIARAHFSGTVTVAVERGEEDDVLARRAMRVSLFGMTGKFKAGCCWM